MSRIKKKMKIFFLEDPGLYPFNGDCVYNFYLFILFCICACQHQCESARLESVQKPVYVCKLNTILWKYSIMHVYCTICYSKTELLKLGKL